MTEEPPTVDLTIYIERRDDYKDPEYSNDSDGLDVPSQKDYGIIIDFSKPFKEKSILDSYDDIEDESILKESSLEERVKPELFDFKLAA